MSAVAIAKLFHILSAFWFISGLLGRGVALSQASRASDVKTVQALVQLGGRFEQLMVRPGSLAVFLIGLLTAWLQGWPILGFLQGGMVNWVLASIVLYLSLVPIIPLVFLPRDRLFETALQDALTQGQVTPELRAAFGDRAVAVAHAYELAVVAVIVLLMVTKPF